MSHKDFKLILVDINLELCKRLRTAFKPHERVEVYCDKFENLKEFDCMVSPANSFGLMDGGVDAKIIKFFGEQLMSRVQKYIIENFDGEQPVGTSFIIETGNPKHKYLAHTPTMRVPYSVDKTDYVYLAMKAMLNAVAKFNKQNKNAIKSVACTGLGTFYGQVPYDEAARQMELAYRNFREVPKKLDWNFANKRQREVIWGGNHRNPYIYKFIKEETPSEEKQTLIESKLEEISRRAFYNQVILGVDCRPSSEYEKSHIEAAINLPPERGCDEKELDKMKVYVDSMHRVLLYGDTQNKYKNQLQALIKYYSLKPEIKEVVVLSGGYERFEEAYPFICEGNKQYHGQGDAIFPAHILEYIFLSSSLIAQNKLVLKSLGIKYILNITKEDKNFFENDKELGITYLKVDVEDSATENINVWFEECFKFLDKAISEKKRVLVHCHHGISRSATVVIAYLMKNMHWSLEKSYKFVKKARPIARPNRGFMHQLEQMELHIFNDLENEEEEVVLSSSLK